MVSSWLWFLLTSGLTISGITSLNIFYLSHERTESFFFIFTGLFNSSAIRFISWFSSSTLKSSGFYAQNGELFSPLRIFSSPTFCPPQSRNLGPSLHESLTRAVAIIVLWVCLALRDFLGSRAALFGFSYFVSSESCTDYTNRLSGEFIGEFYACISLEFWLFCR